MRAREREFTGREKKSTYSCARARARARAETRVLQKEQRMQLVQSRDETPKDAKETNSPVSLCLSETVCTSCTHGLPAYREQVAGVRGCRPKTGGYAVAAGPADGN